MVEEGSAGDVTPGRRAEERRSVLALQLSQPARSISRLTKELSSFLRASVPISAAQCSRHSISKGLRGRKPIPMALNQDLSVFSPMLDDSPLQRKRFAWEIDLTPGKYC